MVGDLRTGVGIPISARSDDRLLYHNENIQMRHTYIKTCARQATRTNTHAHTVARLRACPWKRVRMADVEMHSSNACSNRSNSLKSTTIRRDE